MNTLNLPSPILLLQTFESGIQLYIKREDLIHPHFGGNKWRKLKFNIDYFLSNNYSHLITFGGPFSNHIAATASVCKYYKIPCIGLIRGTFNDLNNPTLQKASSNGMVLKHIPKSEYKLKSESNAVKKILNEYKKPFLVPEGGSNENSLLGLKEMSNEIKNQGDFDQVFISAGTGMTASGLIKYSESSFINVIASLNDYSLDDNIRTITNNSSKNWKLSFDYTFGGYAKWNNQLQQFAQNFKNQFNIILDPIYNVKTAFACFDFIKNNKIQPNTKVLLIHTGGLQGIEGFEYTNKVDWITS